jgi:hypothetical protein
MNSLQKQLRFSDLRYLDHHVRLPMRYDALKTILIIIATLAIGYAIFYELVQLCLAIGISAWWAAGGFVGLYALLLCRGCKLSLFQPNPGE